MPTVQVRGENGDIVTQEILSREASVVTAEQEDFEPAVVQRLEYDHRGQSSSITSVCGETENRRESDQQPDITMEGIITEGQIPTAKNLKRGDEITLVSDIHQGTVFVKRLTIEQSTDIIRYVDTQTGEESLAFSFQLQLGQPGDAP
jgi:hypothetical protein